MKIRLLPPLCLLAVLAGCAAPEPPSAPEPVHSASTYEQAALLAGTMEFLHQNYVDADRAGYEKLLTAALRGMMRELDPYSGYEPPAVYETNEIARTGEHTGIGVELVKPGENSPLVVTMTVLDSPAAKAGLVPGDRIVRIDDKPVEPAAARGVRETSARSRRQQRQARGRAGRRRRQPEHCGQA